MVEILTRWENASSDWVHGRSEKIYIYIYIYLIKRKTSEYRSVPDRREEKKCWCSRVDVYVCMILYEEGYKSTRVKSIERTKQEI